MSAAPSYLTIEAAAELLACHPATVRRLIGRGDLKAYRVGRLIRIRPADLDRALKPVTTVTRSGGDHE